MSFVRFAGMFLAFNSCMADNTDAVQIAMNATRSGIGGMPCNDPTYGFINNGQDVTGYLKSCPISFPHHRPNLNCSTDMCLVDPDRYHCCSVCECTCPNGDPTIGDTTNGTNPPPEDQLCDCDVYGEGEDCYQCEDTHYLNSPAGPGMQHCLPKICYCDNGKRTTNTGGVTEKCEVHGEHDCYECNDGYHLSADAGTGSQTCEPNVCQCSNGMATWHAGSGATLCKDHGTYDCSECDCGYSLSSPGTVQSEICVAHGCNNKSSISALDETIYDKSACDSTVSTDTECAVSCQSPYTGAPKMFECGCDGVLVARSSDPFPTCSKILCSTTELDPPANVVPSGDCGEFGDGAYTLTAAGNCILECAPGYEPVPGTSPTSTQTCTETETAGDGTSTLSWETTTTNSEDHLECIPKNCTMTTPANGGLGDCTMHMPHGSTCEITCNIGYTGHGQTQCLLGNMTNPTACWPANCSHVGPPENGLIGNCPSVHPFTLQHGTDCQPQCQTGYYLSATNDKTTCRNGVLTLATCEPCLYCRLIYKKKCSDNRGFWTTATAHLDYEGCERFCNMKHATSGHTIHGCELDGPTSEVRLSKGKWCFAHTGACTLTQKPAPHDNAACDCLPGTLASGASTCPGNAHGSSSGNVVSQPSGNVASDDGTTSDAGSTDGVTSSSLSTVGHRTQNDVNPAAQNSLSVDHLGNKSNTSKHGFKRHVR